MRVLYLHQYFNTPRMAGGTRSYEFARRLVDRGHEVVMVTTRRDPRTAENGWVVTDEDGIEVHWRCVPYSNEMSYVRRVAAFAEFAWHGARRAAAVGGDVVFATSTPLTIALPGVYAARRLGVPMVFEVRDLWPELPIAMGALPTPLLRGAARLLERWAYRNSARIIALSPGMRDGVVKTGYPRERVFVIPNSSDLDRFDVPDSKGREFRSVHPALRDRPLIVYAGTLGRINGVGYLVEIASQAAGIDGEVAFVVVGTGYDLDHVRLRADKAGVLDRNFFLLPEQPKAEMPKVLSAADVIVSLFVDLEPMWANSANKFFDGLAAGRPVVINYGGWQADVLERAGAGFAMPPNDARRAAAQLVELVRDESRKAAMGRAARELARREFDRDALATQFIQVLESVVMGGVAPNQDP